MGFDSARDALDELVDAYYNARSIEAVLLCVTEDIIWVGTENNDSAKGKAELRTLLEADLAFFPDSFDIELEEPEVRTLSEDVTMITVFGRQKEVLGKSVGFTIRGTACCVKTQEGWKINNVHTSVPNSEMEKVFLQNELDTEREKQKALLEYVPGGIAMYRAKKDGRIATDYVSDSLAKICGYEDGKDIMKVMRYDSRKLVLPEDYPAIAVACKASLETGVPTSVNYRVYRKDGKPVRITLDSIVIKNAVLQEDDVAVFYAVQTLVSEESNRIIENEKTMSALLDSVPAGLGIYEMQYDNVAQVYMNNAFYDMIGSKREKRKQFFGKNAITAAHAEDIPKIKNALNELMAGNQDVQVDYRLERDGGGWLWIHANCSVVERRENYIKIYAAFYDCTESKLQQLQLLQNQYAVELAQQQGNMAIWIFNIDRRTIMQQTSVEVNGHMGYPSYIENVPLCFIEKARVHLEDVQKFLHAYKRLEDGEETVEEIYRLMDQRTGRYNWVKMFYQRMRNNDEGERMAVGFSMNANKQQEAIERYQTEKKLREQMYSDAVIYIEYNLTTNQYETNHKLPKKYNMRQWEEISKEEYIQNMQYDVEDVFKERMAEKMYAKNLLEAFKNGENKVSIEFRSRKKSNISPTWYRATATMVQSPDRDDVMAFIYVENIEKEKKRQLAMESSMIDGIKSIAIIHAADGVSRLIRTSYDSTPEDVGEYFIYNDDFVRRSRGAVLSGEKESDPKAAYLSTVTEQLKSKDSYQYSISTIGSDKVLKRQLFRFRYLDDRKEDIVLSVSDITSIYMEEQGKKKQLENALREVKKASRAKAEFYSRMSHDMRTPMNGILGMAELSEDETDIKK